MEYSGLADEVECPVHYTVFDLAKTAAIVPATNAWPEQGASAMKRIKLQTASRIKTTFSTVCSTYQSMVPL